MTGVDGRVIAIAGATGGVGEGITRAELAAGATVLAIGRSSDALVQLGERVGGAERFVPLALDLAAEEPAIVTQRIRDRVGAVDLSIITLGAPPSGPPSPVLDVSDEEFFEIVGGNELMTLRALRGLVPATRPTGAVVGLVGFSGEVPFPQNPVIGASNAGARSILVSLGAQLAGSGPNVHALVIGVVRTRARQAAGIDNPRWLTGDQVGERAIELYDAPEPSVSHLLDPGTKAS